MYSRIVGAVLLVLLAACSSSNNTVIEHEIATPTATAVPTPTPVPLAELDLASLMFVEGDFPEAYEPQTPQAPIDIGPDPAIIPLAELMQDRLFNGTKNGRPHIFIGGSTTLQIYRTPEEARQIYEEDLAGPSWEFPRDYEIGDGGTVELKQLVKGDPSSNAFRIEFIRCHALAYVTVFNTDDPNILLTYAARLDMRLMETVCRPKEPAIP